MKVNLQLSVIFIVSCFLFFTVAVTCVLAQSPPASPLDPITKNPEKTALLLLHFQNQLLKFKAGVSDYAPKLRELVKKAGTVENAQAALKASREKGILVAFVRLAYRPGHPELPSQEELLPRRRRMRDKQLYVDGTWNTEIVDEVKPLKNEIVVNNTSLSAFMVNDLDFILRSHNIRYLVLAGITTQHITTGTVIGAYNRGYYTFVLGDCCHGFTQEGHDYHLKKIFPSYSIVTDSKQYINALDKIKK